MRLCVCVRVCACVRVFMYVCVCVCVIECESHVRACVRVENVDSCVDMRACTGALTYAHTRVEKRQRQRQRRPQSTMKNKYNILDLQFLQS